MARYLDDEDPEPDVGTIAMDKYSKNWIRLSDASLPDNWRCSDGRRLPWEDLAGDVNGPVSIMEV